MNVIDKEHSFGYNLTNRDVVGYAKEEIEYILGNKQGGIYDPNTDEVEFDLSKIGSTARLYCFDHTSNELKFVTEVSYLHTEEKYNRYVDKVILLCLLFKKKIPEIYKGFYR